MASFYQIEISVEGAYKNLEKFNPLYKEKLSIFPIEEKEESLKKFRVIE